MSVLYKESKKMISLHLLLFFIKVNYTNNINSLNISGVVLSVDIFTKVFYVIQLNEFETNKLDFFMYIIKLSTRN